MLRDILTETMEWFQKAVSVPTNKNLHTQLGCHLEEVNEMLMTVSTMDFETQILLDTAKTALNALSNHLKTHNDVVMIHQKNREEYLDALCDQIVTAVGCGHMSDLDVVGAVAEVNRSNFSKFDEHGQPIFNDDLKVMKGPNYQKADLAAYV